jgi:hypothetical protein
VVLIIFTIDTLLAANPIAIYPTSRNNFCSENNNTPAVAMTSAITPLPPEEYGYSTEPYYCPFDCFLTAPGAEGAESIDKLSIYSLRARRENY